MDESSKKKTTAREALTTLDARRICLIKPSALGDVVQTLPLLPVLKERFPSAKISWVINRSLAELLRGHPALDDVIEFDRHGTWSSWWNTLVELRDRRFDLVFDLQGLLRTAAMTFATRAPMCIGLESAREGAHLACHFTLPDTGLQVPAHRRYWRVAEAIGMESLRSTTTVAVSRPDYVHVSRQLQGLRRPLLAVHPGARWVTKRWPVEKFAVLAAKAAREFGFSVLILGSSDEQRIADQLTQLLGRFVPHTPVRNLAGQTSLKQLAAILSRSDLLVTNDSGPMHLAAGLGTSVVGVFTCTSPVRSGPPGDQHALVATHVSCAAAYRKRCPYQGSQHMACMEELSVDRVWNALAVLMNRKIQDSKAA